jgi:hypothetical protein
MSTHYEVVIACFLRADSNEETLDALRWHLGLLAERPATLPAADHPDRLLCPDPASTLPGGDVAALQPQRFTPRGGGEQDAWGLYSRTRWPEEAMPALAAVMELLAGQVTGGGYGGYFREEGSSEATAFEFAAPPLAGAEAG